MIKQLKLPSRKIITVVLLIAAVDLLALDRWQTSGTVIDAQTGEPVSGAWVLARFSGESPLLRLPIPPHPLHRTDRCMGSRIAQTDEGGRYAFDEITWNRALANKSAYLVVFKPGWLSAPKSTPLRTSLFALPPVGDVQLASGSGTRKNTSTTWPEGIKSRLERAEFTYSEELFRTLEVVAQASAMCGSSDNEMLIVAMAHALTIANTLEERDRTQSMCRWASKHLRSPDAWPFDCNNLPFKHQPNAQVLLVERQLKAKRRIFRETDSTRLEVR